MAGRDSDVVRSVREYAIFTLDRRGVITSWNPGAERIFGHTPDQAIGRDTSVLFTPEDRLAGAPENERRQAATTGRAEDERWHIRADGSRFFASGILFSQRDDVGELSGFVKVARDITHRKRSEDNLQRANDALEESIRERTEDLRRAIDALQSEVLERRVAEERIKALFQQLVTAQEEERKRIAREIHDQVGQQITALRITLASLDAQLTPDSPAAAHSRTAQALAGELDATIDVLTWQLRPITLDHFGLTAAIARLLEDWGHRTGIHTEFDASAVGEIRLPPDAETQLYRITREALHNVLKHASATQVSVFLGRRDRDAVLVIEDDGVGFHGEEPGHPPADGTAGLGILGMRERAALVGGQLEIESKPGSGTSVFVRVPVDR